MRRLADAERHDISVDITPRDRHYYGLVLERMRLTVTHVRCAAGTTKERGGNSIFARQLIIGDADPGEAGYSIQRRVAATSRRVPRRDGDIQRLQMLKRVADGATAYQASASANVIARID